MGQVELFAGKGDGRLKAHPVCPDEGSCLQKVITRCRFGRELIRNFAVSCVEVETSTAVDQIPCTLDRCAISALIRVLSTVFRMEKWRIVGASLRVLFPGDR